MKKHKAIALDATTETPAIPQFGVFTGVPLPQRLPAATRALAARYLSGEFGRAMQPTAFGLPPDLYLSLPTPNRLYAEAVRRVAAQAPLRVLPEEHLAGAATLREAAGHTIPLLPWWSSISHTTFGFDKALRLGCRGLRQEVEARLAAGNLDEDGRDLLDAMLACLDALAVWHGRHLTALEELAATQTGAARQRVEAVLTAIRPVPENPPATFHEALQSLWFLWSFQRLMGNWSGLGRVDDMLGPYLERDLAAGRLTLDNARDLIAHFWIKGCEWTTGDTEHRGSGDAQFYQNVILGGVNADGKEVANTVTDLVLDVVEELHISDFPVAVRLNRQTPRRLVRRLAEVQRLGGGIVSIYNEERILPMLERFGYAAAEARTFTNDGCWELLIPGRTSFNYQPFDLLRILQETLGIRPAHVKDRPFGFDFGPEENPQSKLPPGWPSVWPPFSFTVGRDAGNEAPTPQPPLSEFDRLFEAFRTRLALRLTELLTHGNLAQTAPPNPLAALLVEDCIARARGYHAGGPRYTVLAPHAGGLADTADSLLAIRRLVYEQHRLTLPELAAILENNWAGHEELRRETLSTQVGYGNHDAAADAMMGRVFDAYTGLLDQVRERHGILRPAGISTFGREGSTFHLTRAATASGHLQGEVLAANCSPTPGADRHGPTAVLQSCCSLDFSKLPCGTALDLRLFPQSLAGDSGVDALAGLLQAFVSLGGIYLQVDAVDPAVLRDAQQHPERYPNLTVRISGWSARFATLDPEWQEMVIQRSTHAL
ncbi:MAG: pyruvate formate lyase family protein [Lentisphaeria bacterium]